MCPGFRDSITSRRGEVLDAIPWERRGGFLAAAWLLMRTKEIRAIDITDFDPDRRALAVYKAFKGPRLDDPIAHTKEMESSWREAT